MCHFLWIILKNFDSEFSDHFVETIELGSNTSLKEKIRLAPKSVYSFEAKRKFRTLLNEFEPHLCHLHNIYHHLSPSFLSSLKQANVPTVMTMHDLKLACPAYNMFGDRGVCEECKGGQYRNLLKNKCINNSLLLSGLVYFETYLHKFLKSYTANVDRFIVPSKFYAEKFAEWGLDKSKIRYIPNAIDVASFKPGFEESDYFLYVGRLVDQKGVHTLIKATAKAGVKLKVVGTGADEQALKSLAETENANVEFAGYLSGEDLHSAIRNARAAVLPSEWYENAPISVLEAYALGTPIIGADIGGIPELIQQNETGVTFTAADVDDLADKLLAYQNMSVASLRHQGENGRALVAEQYDKTKHLEQLLSLYSELGVPNL